MVYQDLRWLNFLLLGNHNGYLVHVIYNYIVNCIYCYVP